MKLITFSVQTHLGTQTRIGALLGDKALDLNFAYAAMLHDSGKTERYYPLAEALVPSDMITFLQGGEQSMSAAKQAIEFVQQRRANNQALRGPDKQILLYALKDIELLAPVTNPGSIRDTISFETHAKNLSLIHI